MARRIPIRIKLTAALALPMVTVLTLATSKVLEGRDDAREVREQTELAVFATGPRSLLRSLQAERDHTTAYLLDIERLVDLPQASLGEERPVTDAALEDFESTVRATGGQIEETFRPALEAMDGLDEVRGRVDAFTQPRSFQTVEFAEEIFGEYGRLINGLFNAGARVTSGVSDPTLRRGANLVTEASQGADTVALLTRELLVATAGGPADGVNTAPELGSVARLLSRLRDNQDAIRAGAVGPYRRDVEAFLAGDTAQRFPEVVQAALETTVVDIPSLFSSAGGEGVSGYDQLLDAVEEQLDREADRLTGDARRQQSLYLFAGAGGILLAGIVTWLVSRSITRPLRALTRQATAMAHERLPSAVQHILDTPLGEDVTVQSLSPVAVTTRDEVADVADALNTVQDSALELAVEQAVLRRNIADSFVNLGRRNQNLLSRQLDFITELERNETDPDALASLFRLDHLATRMRRNAESLLVLAGIEPPRKWAAPVRLADTIRSALGEVEDYHRVTVRAVEPATTVGSAATDLAHLIAELVENALAFSPPDQTVEVRGRSQPPGYSLAIIDAGLGMAPDELEAANRRLAGEESFTIAPSKYLGHYVAGNLAARHGVKVELHNSPVHDGASGRGITAVITLPERLLTTTTDDDTAAGAVPRGAPPASAGAASRALPPASSPVASVPGGPAPAGSAPAAAVTASTSPLAAGVGALPAGAAAASGIAPPPARDRQPAGSTPWASPGGSPAGGAPPSSGAPAAPPVSAGPAVAGLRTSAGSPPGSPASAGPAAAMPPSVTPPGATSLGATPRSRNFPLVPPPDVPPVADLGPAAAPNGGGRSPLARRVPGAQLPDTRPLKVQRVTHRPAGPHSSPSPASPWQAPGRSPAPSPPAADDERRTPDQIYSFLSRFSAGVKHGRDDARKQHGGNGADGGSPA